MGRSSEFQGAAYGNFEPEPVDVDLSDKVTEHPFYSQPSHFRFHEPDEPMSKTCMEPGCGRSVNEHKAIYLPPTRAAAGMFEAVIEGRKTERREASERAAKEDYENEQAMKSPHGTAPHFVSGPGWINEKGPQTPKQLRKHLVDDHELWPEDAKEMERPAVDHARWHANQEFGGETHHHHTDPIRHHPED